MGENGKKKVDSNLLEKIQKLFALGKSPNVNEAEAAIKKAEALMSEYDLSFGEVNYITESEQKGKLYDWEAVVFSAVCYANNCLPVCFKNRYLGTLSFSGRKINVFLSKEMFQYLV